MKQLKSRRGIVGIEAAIVLIAFVVIAAAFSYVVINMGFFATQKTKEAINEGIEESTASLQLDGTATARTGAGGDIAYIVFPVKLSVGGGSVDLGEDSIVVTVYLPNSTLLDIYDGVNGEPKVLNSTVLSSIGDDSAKFFIYNGNGNTVLELQEKAFLIIHLGPGNEMKSYDVAKIEIKPGKGAALTVVRTAPGGLLPDEFIDLS